MATNKHHKEEIEIAQFLPANSKEEADKLHRALALAESTHGKMSAETGLCLMALEDFMERIGRAEDASSFSSRYKEILCEYARKYKLI